MTLADAKRVPLCFGSDWSLRAKRIIELGAELSNMRRLFELEFDADLSKAPSLNNWTAEQLEAEIRNLALRISRKRLAQL